MAATTPSRQHQSSSSAATTTAAAADHDGIFLMDRVNFLTPVLGTSTPATSSFHLDWHHTGTMNGMTSTEASATTTMAAAAEPAGGSGGQVMTMMMTPTLLLPSHHHHQQQPQQSQSQSHHSPHSRHHNLIDMSPQSSHHARSRSSSASSSAPSTSNISLFDFETILHDQDQDHHHHEEAFLHSEGEETTNNNNNQRVSSNNINNDTNHTTSSSSTAESDSPAAVDRIVDVYRRESFTTTTTTASSSSSSSQRGVDAIIDDDDAEVAAAGEVQGRDDRDKPSIVMMMKTVYPHHQLPSVMAPAARQRSTIEHPRGGQPQPLPLPQLQHSKPPNGNDRVMHSISDQLEHLAFPMIDDEDDDDEYMRDDEVHATWMGDDRSTATRRRPPPNLIAPIPLPYPSRSRVAWGGAPQQHQQPQRFHPLSSTIHRPIPTRPNQQHHRHSATATTSRTIQQNEFHPFTNHQEPTNNTSRMISPSTPKLFRLHRRSQTYPTTTSYSYSYSHIDVHDRFQRLPSKVFLPDL